MPTPNRAWRRFFRFHLSTWFVLVGISAWIMACRPHASYEILYGSDPRDEHGYFEVELCWNLSSDVEIIAQPDSYQLNVSTKLPPYAGGLIQINFGPLRLAWPALALLAFLAWKGFWLWREGRRQKTETH